MLVREPLSEAAQEVLADNLAGNLATGEDAFDNWQESAVLGATGGLGQSLALQGVGKGMALGRQQADMTRVLEPVVDLQPGEMRRSTVSDPQAPSPASAHAISNADGLPGAVAGEQSVAAGVVPVRTILPQPDEQHVFEPGQHAEPDPSVPAHEPDVSAVAQATRPDSLARESDNAAANGIEMPADALTTQARVSAADHDSPIVEPVIEPGSESQQHAYWQAQQRRRDAGLYVMRQL
ncbi:hypothetical protein IGB42_02854 [Andreprevotia sp. IGB-42]|uniref:hypothetical protein n=1 Tax=Andreprevotia sp. IGB-42 TaxID=2497473 RepID=UPI0013584D87|nr:hypothetical protein [Andreprevotia sp. IGB-42]KAF0812565.1 hypothetical protein IGB42_02854 [Andreprevotia sp. IGB-42]